MVKATSFIIMITLSLPTEMKVEKVETCSGEVQLGQQSVHVLLPLIVEQN